MARFNVKAQQVGRAAIRTVGEGVNHEGGLGFVSDSKGELFRLAVVNFVGQDTFYESGKARDARYNKLIEAVAVADWPWLSGLLPWLRGEANIRTASVTGAAHAVHARLAAGEYDGNDTLIDGVLQRADEVAEFLAYWRETFGRAIPQAVRRGLGMAIRRLYTPRAVLKWDSPAHGLRMADVIELVHPKPQDAAQDALFKYLLDDRHHGDGNPELAGLIKARKEWYAASDSVKLAALADGSAFKKGLTWENASSELKTRVGEKALWEAMAPHLPYMAALRNLRNMDQAGVSYGTSLKLAARLVDPEEVAGSRQLPYRFLTAYLNAPSDRWKHALEEAINISLKSVPELPGRTLIMVDTSASMHSRGFSERSTATPAMAAALFGGILAQRNPGRVELYGFADGVFRHDVARGEGVLSTVGKFCDRIGDVGHGTQMTQSIRQVYSGQDRVFVISDMQCFADSDGRRLSNGEGFYSTPDVVPVQKGTKVYGVNIGGSSKTAIDTRIKNRFEFSGLGDQVFRQVLALEAGFDEKWPWMV
jgi:hypothetical protein